MVVGLVWLGMIAERLVRGERVWFLIVMVPVLALVRFAACNFYRRTVRRPPLSHGLMAGSALED